MKYFYSVREDFIEKKEKEEYIPLDSKNNKYFLIGKKRKEILKRLYWNQVSLSYKDNISKYTTYHSSEKRFHSYIIARNFLAIPKNILKNIPVNYFLPIISILR